VNEPSAASAAPSEARRTLRAVPTLFRVGFASALAYRSEMLVWILATNMPLVMLALWSAVARDGPVGRFGQRDFVAYFLATLIVRQLSGSWVVWEMNQEIRQGTLGQRLLRPIHPFLSYAADNLAAIPLRVAIALPVATIGLVWAGGDKLTHDPMLWAIVPLSIFGAWLITFSAMLMIGTLGLYFESSLAGYDLWIGLYFVFSGYLLPLELFPSWLLRFVRLSPFPFVLSFPVETMLGLQTRARALAALGMQWVYVAVFLVAAITLWRRGLRRYAAYGG
jgi:ABC-2 type transport system permease protein